MNRTKNHNIINRESNVSTFSRFKTRWPAWLALFIAALLYEALPKELYWGPRRLMIGLVTMLIIPMIVFHWRDKSRITRILSLTVNILITFYMIVSLSRIILAVFAGHIGPIHLFTSTMMLWLTNILVFALWYWNLDAGGPHRRELQETSGLTAFLFPQAQLYLFQTANLPNSIKNWQPHFIDYLFLAFNTSAAFSPTDTPVLSRWAKGISMIQASVSLTIILMLVSRAINILNPSAHYLVP